MIKKVYVVTCAEIQDGGMAWQIVSDAFRKEKDAYRFVEGKTKRSIPKNVCDEYIHDNYSYRIETVHVI